MTAEPALIDTNVLVYIFDLDEPEKRHRSRELISRCWAGECRYAVSLQNLAEFSVIVTEKVEHPLGEEDVNRFIGDIISFDGWEVIHYSGRTIQAAREIRRYNHLHFWDALLIATMKAHGLSALYSEDHHFAGVPGITAINPYTSP
jgi:predicted nucleic acid-binding protein